MAGLPIYLVLKEKSKTMVGLAVKLLQVRHEHQ